MNKKMLITIGIIVTAIGLVILGAGLFKKNINDNILDGPGMVREPELTSFSYYHGGSSIGDLYRITLEESSFTVEQCEGNGHKTISKTYNVENDIYFELDMIINKYEMKSWNELPDSEYFALDAATTSVDLYFRDGSRIHFDSEKELPENGWEAVNEMLALFEAKMDK